MMSVFMKSPEMERLYAHEVVIASDCSLVAARSNAKR